MQEFWPLGPSSDGTCRLTIDDVRSDNNFALRYSAANGHIDVLKYLRNSSRLTLRDARANNNEALRVSAANGHLAGHARLSRRQ